MRENGGKRSQERSSRVIDVWTSFFFHLEVRTCDGMDVMSLFSVERLLQLGTCFGYKYNMLLIYSSRL